MIIPPPRYTEEDVKESVGSTDESRDHWIRWYWFCEDWKCRSCNAVNFGRCKECVYCKMKNGIHTPRPDSYIETPYIPE